MVEKGPIPISRGIEIQKNKIEEIQKRALNRYRELTVLSRALEDEIDIALSKLPTDESTVALTGLFEKKHALEEIGRQLEELVLRGFEHQEELQDRWEALERRFADLEQPPHSDSSP